MSVLENVSVDWTCCFACHRAVETVGQLGCHCLDPLHSALRGNLDDACPQNHLANPRTKEPILGCAMLESEFVNCILRNNEPQSE